MDSSANIPGHLGSEVRTVSSGIFHCGRKSPLRVAPPPLASAWRPGGGFRKPVEKWLADEYHTEEVASACSKSVEELS
jgi:hypothetical protein